MIATARQPAPEEIQQIIDRTATAPFNPSVVPVRVEHQGLTYQGRTLATREDSLTYHLIQRVVVEGQWAHGTTAGQFLADLQHAVRDPSARLAIYQRRGGAIAATVTPTDRVLPPGRRGANSERNLLVVYSADRSMIVSGYQFSEVTSTGIPKDARWLK